MYQMEDRGSKEGNIEAACRVVETCSADFVCLPEFFAIPVGVKDPVEAWRISVDALEALREASGRTACYVVAGSLVEKDGRDYYNTCYVLRKGSVVGKYRKMKPTDKELKAGIKPGSRPLRVKTEYGTIGVMICADILHEDAVERAVPGCDIVFLPISVTSPDHARVEGHPLSKLVASKYGVVVVKVARIGVVGGVKVGVKSAVVTPTRIYEAPSEGEEVFEVELPGD